MFDFSARFERLSGGRAAYDYQTRVADALFERRHLLLRAPTGAGKTLAVLVPFLLARERVGVRTLIYVLPVRTLVEAVYDEASRLAAPLRLSVAMQTGERADAEFFDGSDIIVTTFDQVLSGLLCEPYGLPAKLWNINAAAMAGKLIVFDEFHLMGPSSAFLTALFGVELFKQHAVSVWMTATATSALTERIISRLGAVEIDLSVEEKAALFEGRGISRSLRTHWGHELTVDEILRYREQRVLAVVNTVKKAQALSRALAECGCEPLLLHGRFFSDDRRDQQRKLAGSRMTIATQVIEAGVDISSDALLTEVAPVNAVVQRAGRCARFEGESGMVHVFDAPARPYEAAAIDCARSVVADTDALTPTLCAEWVERAHRLSDAAEIADFHDGTAKRRTLILGHITGDGERGAAKYIRPGEDTLRLFIIEKPDGVKPGARQAIQVYRTQLLPFRGLGWTYEDGDWVKAGDIKGAYAVALPPSVASYSRRFGLELGRAGEIESPVKAERCRPGYGSLKAEPWVSHSRAVECEAVHRLSLEGLPLGLEKLVRVTALLHDLGKLQHIWQEWAHERQRAMGNPFAVALAHTDYEFERDRGARKPPPHASASTIYGEAYLRELDEKERTAVLLAVFAHHGGTLKGRLPADKAHKLADEALGAVELPVVRTASYVTLFDDLRDGFIEAFADIWPLAAILSRVLRLSDQKATSEAALE